MKITFVSRIKYNANYFYYYYTFLFMSIYFNNISKKYGTINIVRVSQINGKLLIIINVNLWYSKKKNRINFDFHFN